MPELPEVETIKNGLAAKIIGKAIKEITVETAKSFQGDKNKVIGAKIIDIKRRAKTIQVELSNDLYLVFHLKMTGQLIYIDHNKRFAGGHPSHDWHASLPNKYTRVTFVFDDGTTLFFNDLRKFGWCKVMNQQEIEGFNHTFGPEPFSPEFNVKYLQKRAARVPSRTLKQFIMDQAIIAGIGNIYADESLFLAGIMPTTKVSVLKEDDWQNVIKAIKGILKKGIQFGGTTDSDYVNAEGQQGGMQFHLNVYHKNGEPCSQKGCQGTIKKTKLGGRGTYYCESCQKELK